MQLDELFRVLERQPKFRHGIAASLDHVKVIEKSLSVKIPEQFGTFLKRFGFAIWEGHAIYGVYELGSVLPPSFDFDVARQTVKHRNRGVPAPFAAVSSDGMVIKKYEGGGFYFLFCEGSSRVGQIVLFEFANDICEVERWENLESFLRYLLR